MKKSNQHLSPLLLGVFIFRTLVPLLLFIKPAIAIPLSLFLDAIDGQLFFNSGFKWRAYNLIDKILDYWWYIFLLTFLILQHPQTALIGGILFLVRSIGQFWGAVFSKEKAYLFFPNAFEWFAFLVILSNLNMKSALIISLVVGVSVEFWFHVFKPNLGSRFVFRREIKWSKN